VSSASVSAIIVTRNSRRDITRTLASLHDSIHPLHEVIVIDHDSTDGTADHVRRDHRDVVLLDFLDNPGFGAGNNRGARVATGEYLLFLNPDATIDPDCLAALVQALDAEPHAGIAVPKVMLASEPSIINTAGLVVNRIGYGWDRGYLEWDRGQYDTRGPVLAGSGCALLVRADTFRALEGFDAAYFLYYEDLDLCWRCWLAGYTVTYVPAAVARHTMKITDRPVFYNEYLDHRNRLRTLAKTLSGRSIARLAGRVAAFEAGSAWALARQGRWDALRLRTQAWTWHASQARETLRLRRVVQRSRVLPDDSLAGLLDPGTGAPRLNAVVPSYPAAYTDTLERERLSSDLTLGDGDVGALGLGWHAPELMDRQPYRWTSGYGIVFLRAPARGRTAVRLTCRALLPTGLELHVDGVPCARFTVEPGGWRDLSAHVDTVDDVVRIDILPALTFRPCEVDPRAADARLLGVRVARVQLRSE